MKRILVVTFFTLLLCLVSFWIVKLWGRSQTYNEYRHPVLSETQTPVEFIKPTFANIKTELSGTKNIYLDVSITQDQKLVMLTRAWDKKETQLKYLDYDAVKNDAILLSDYKDQLKNRKIIFNIAENVQAGHEIFFHNIKQLGLERGENFIVTSPYEASIKALKENQPELIFATTQPEILKILAMNSMYLLEAANIRADVIIHPLEVRGQDFFTERLMTEFKRRHKKVIVGPITTDQKEKAISLNPYGLVILN